MLIAIEFFQFKSLLHLPNYFLSFYISIHRLPVFEIKMDNLELSSRKEGAGKWRENEGKYESS